MARNYRNIRAWQKADELAMKVYELTADFPKTEIYGLTSQMRRAALSVAANIVEGSARNHTREYIQFLYLAMGSLAELGYFIDFAGRISYLNPDAAQVLNVCHEQAAKTLRALITYIEEHRSENSGPPMSPQSEVRSLSSA